MAEGDYLLSASFELANVEEFVKVKTGDKAEFKLEGLSLVFLIENKQKKRKFGNITYEIEGRSPSCLLDLPYASLIDKKWSQTTAKNIICELAQDFEVIFDISDFPIYEFELKQQTPLTGIKRICEATGAVVETTPEGKLRVRYLYPISPTLYSKTTPDLILSDLDDILSIEEELEIKEDYNVVAVSNDRDIEYEMKFFVNDKEVNELEPFQVGLLKVWCYPFKNELELKTSDEIQITFCGIEKEQITEQIEIINNEGSTTYFVGQILSYQWIGDNLGEIKAEGKKIFTLEAYKPAGILEITYTHSFYKYMIRNNSETTVIIYIENEEE